MYVSLCTFFYRNKQPNNLTKLSSRLFSFYLGMKCSRRFLAQNQQSILTEAQCQAQVFLLGFLPCDMHPESGSEIKKSDSIILILWGYNGISIYISDMTDNMMFGCLKIVYTSKMAILIGKKPSFSPLAKNEASSTASLSRLHS